MVPDLAVVMKVFPLRPNVENIGVVVTRSGDTTVAELLGGWGRETAATVSTPGVEVLIEVARGTALGARDVSDHGWNIPQRWVVEKKIFGKISGERLGGFPRQWYNTVRKELKCKNVRGVIRLFHKRGF